MAADMSIDTNRGEQWCDAVNEINDRVQKIMSEVAQIIQDVGNSDDGGTIGLKLVKAAAGYVTKFAQMVKTFTNVVEQIMTYLGKAAQFVQKTLGVVSTVAKIVAVFI